MHQFGRSEQIRLRETFAVLAFQFLTYREWPHFDKSVLIAHHLQFIQIESVHLRNFSLLPFMQADHIAL